MTDSVSERDLRDIVREIATLSADVRNFMSTHEGMKSDINVLKADLSAVKSDIAEIKSQRRATFAYVSALTTAGGVFWIFFAEKVKKILGL